MKRFVSIFCAAVLLLCVLAAPANAVEKEEGQLFQFPEQGVIESIRIENKDVYDEYTISDPAEVQKAVKLLNDFRYTSTKEVADLIVGEARVRFILTLKGKSGSGFEEQSYVFAHNRIRVGDTQYYGKDRYFNELFQPVSHQHIEHYMGDVTLYLERDRNGVSILDTKGQFRGDVVLPDTMKGFPVLGITYYTGDGPATQERHYGLSGHSEMTSLTMPSTLQDFWIDGPYDAVFAGCDSLRGLIFPGNGPEELASPIYGSNDKANMLSSAKHLERVVLPKKVKTFSTSGFSNLKEVVLDPSNPHFVKDTQGVIYNREKTELITAADGSAERKELTIPDTVTKIAVGAFDSSGGLLKIHGGSNVKTANRGLVAACKELNPFSDTYGHWSEEYAKWAFQNDIFAGTGAFSFSPDDKLTRGMAAAVLYRLEGEPSQSGSIPFTDVPAAAYYAKAVRWASQNGVVYGCDAKTFAPNDKITREQMACMLYRYAKLKGEVSPGGALDKFTDADKVHDWAKEAMQWAVGEGIVFGKGNGILDPQGTATRAEVAAVLKNFAGV